MAQQARNIFSTIPEADHLTMPAQKRTQVPDQNADT
jgi:hypothetical protein